MLLFSFFNLKVKFMKKQSLFLLSGCFGLMLSSCATTPLKPGAENVIVTDSTHMPTSCKKLGQVSAFDTNGSSVAFTSHERMQEYQLNSLKNKTVDLGGNVIVITAHETTYSDKHDKEPDALDTHLMQGNAYACSASELTLIAPSVNHSDLTHKEAAEG
jgi:hypothetical protein